MVGLLLTSEEVNINGENYERVLLWDSVIDDPRSQDSEEDWLPTRSEFASIEFANLFASQCTDGLHRLAIDVDCSSMGIPIEQVLEELEVLPGVLKESIEGLRYWESSTPGNYHVIADSGMSWVVYSLLLTHLKVLGYIQEGYYQASIERKRTQLRLPHIKKPQPIGGM